MFAPAIGVNEDIINGNSSGCLGTWMLHCIGGNRLELRVTQGQLFDRLSEVRVLVTKEGNRYSTVIGGTARITGEMTVSLKNEQT